MLLCEIFAILRRVNVHDGARWYNPTLGQFTTQDTNSYLNNPANGNRYAYAADNPLNNTDPTGNSVWADIVGAWVTLSTSFPLYAIGNAFLNGEGGALAGGGAGCLGTGIANVLNGGGYGGFLEGCGISGAVGAALAKAGLDVGSFLGEASEDVPIE